MGGKWAICCYAEDNTRKTSWGDATIPYPERIYINFSFTGYIAFSKWCRKAAQRKREKEERIRSTETTAKLLNLVQEDINNAYVKIAEEVRKVK